MPLDAPRCIQLDAEAFGKFGPRRKITAERNECRKKRIEKENTLRRGQCLILHSASGGSPDSHRASLQMVALTLRQNSRTRFENIEEQRQWPVS
jgi:hypothetical protein